MKRNAGAPTLDDAFIALAGQKLDEEDGGKKREEVLESSSQEPVVSSQD